MRPIVISPPATRPLRKAIRKAPIPEPYEPWYTIFFKLTNFMKDFWGLR
jgi:hypothetical protein